MELLDALLQILDEDDQKMQQREVASSGPPEKR